VEDGITGKRGCFVLARRQQPTIGERLPIEEQLESLTIAPELMSQHNLALSNVVVSVPSIGSSRKERVRTVHWTGGIDVPKRII
jgi:hypothetical protein